MTTPYFTSSGRSRITNDLPIDEFATCADSPRCEHKVFLQGCLGLRDNSSDLGDRRTIAELSRALGRVLYGDVHLVVCGEVLGQDCERPMRADDLHCGIDTHRRVNPAGTTRGEAEFQSKWRQMPKLIVDEDFELLPEEHGDPVAFDRGAESETMVLAEIEQRQRDVGWNLDGRVLDPLEVVVSPVELGTAGGTGVDSTAEELVANDRGANLEGLVDPAGGWPALRGSSLRPCPGGSGHPRVPDGSRGEVRRSCRTQTVACSSAELCHDDGDLALEILLH